MLVATLLLPPLRCFSALVRLFVVDPRITDSPLRKSFVPEFRPGPSPASFLHHLPPGHRGIFYLRCPALSSGGRARHCGLRARVIAGREKHIERNLCVGETSNRTAQSGRISPRLELINSNKWPPAYVRPFLRHRFHRSGSRSVKDSSLLAFPHSPSISVSLSRDATSTREATLLFRHPSAFLFVLTRSWTARGVPPGGCWILRGSFAPRSLPISEFVLLETFREMIFCFPFFLFLRFFFLSFFLI